jgi:hypothetical protein
MEPEVGHRPEQGAVLVECPIGFDRLLEMFWLVDGAETAPHHQVRTWCDGCGGIDLDEG